jgi:hypothetical protein
MTKIMKYTKHFLKKAEDLFTEMDYIIRYERGSFKSGYCIVEDRKIAVINKFFDTEARINTLVEILNVIEIDLGQLSEAGRSVYKEMTRPISSEKAATEEVQVPIAEDKEVLEETT